MMYLCIREAFQKKPHKIYDIEQMGGQVANLKHDFFPKRNYDKRVGARIISQIIKTMNNSLFIEKHYSKPTVITFTFIFLPMSSEIYYVVSLQKQYYWLLNTILLSVKNLNIKNNLTEIMNRTYKFTYPVLAPNVCQCQIALTNNKNLGKDINN